MFKSLTLVLLFSTVFLAFSQSPIPTECLESLTMFYDFIGKAELPSFDYLDIIDLYRVVGNSTETCDFKQLINIGLKGMQGLPELAENLEDPTQLYSTFNQLEAPFNFTIGFIEGLEKDPIKRHSQCKIHVHNASNSTKNVKDLLIPAITDSAAREKLFAEIRNIREVLNNIPVGCQFEDFLYVIQHLNDTAYIAKVALMYTLYKKTIDGAIRDLKTALSVKNFYAVGNNLGIVTRYLFSITLKEPVKVFSIESMEEVVMEGFNFISSFLAERD